MSTPAGLSPAACAITPTSTKVFSRTQEAELLAYRESLNPAKIGRQIADLQTRLFVLAKDKTEQLYLADFPTALPDIRDHPQFTIVLPL